MAVMKATISMEVYFTEEDAARFRGATLEEVLYEVDQGGWIGGSPKKSEPVTVPAENVRAEMEAIGNDGSFFDDTDVEDLTGGAKY